MSIRVVAAVVEHENRYLVCQRPLHKHHGGLWEFPGGKVHSGESDADAVVRELSEELAVQTTRIGDVLFTAEDPGAEFEINFVSATIEGTPILREHIALAWLSPAELRDLPLAPSDQAFVAGWFTEER